MWENAYLSIKNPKASRALKQALDPGHKLLASLAQLCFATSATFGLSTWGPPLHQILDPHLKNIDAHKATHEIESKLWSLRHETFRGDVIVSSVLSLRDWKVQNARFEIHSFFIFFCFYMVCQTLTLLAWSNFAGLLGVSLFNGWRSTEDLGNILATLW